MDERDLLPDCVRHLYDIGVDEVVVRDAGSTDGSLDDLSPAVEIHRNPQNLGRTANWNRAPEIAEAEGFTYATFLFVLGLAGTAAAQTATPAPAPWTGSLAAGLALTGGNTSTATTNLAFTVESDKTRRNVIG